MTIYCGCLSLNKILSTKEKILLTAMYIFFASHMITENEPIRFTITEECEVKQ